MDQTDNFYKVVKLSKNYLSSYLIQCDDEIGIKFFRDLLNLASLEILEYNVYSKGRSHDKYKSHEFLISTIFNDKKYEFGVLVEYDDEFADGNYGESLCLGLICFKFPKFKIKEVYDDFGDCDKQNYLLTEELLKHLQST